MIKKCSKCQGSGVICYKYQDGDHEHELDDVCDECEGSGLVGTKKDERDIYVRALNLWGNAAQINMAIEECAELIVKLVKSDRRNNGATIDEIAEEIADVEIMMSQLRILFGDEAVEAAKIKKLARLEERLKVAEGSKHWGKTA